MIGFCISYLYVFLLLVIGTRFERYSKEVSRKFVHIMTANWWFIVMVCFKEPFWAIIVALSFILGNLITYKYSFFTCIEREDRKKDKGTIYYAITLLVLVILSFHYEDMLIGLIGSMVMGYADGLAALCGKWLNWIPYSIRGNKKSLSGSLTMFVVTSIIVWGVLECRGYNHKIGLALIMGIIGAGLEAISVKGRDNLTVPLGIVGVYILCVK
ncbi:MAG: hypothetical protein RR309_06835 [Cellulosilyticaceae bacterium]